MFHTSLYSSQPCEQTFRHMRSLGTTNFTKINFTIYELLHMISRIELMNSISNSKWDEGNVLFPESKTKSQGTNEVKLPTNNEIIITMENALKDALQNKRKFGMIFASTDVVKCPLKPTVENCDTLDDTDFFPDGDSDDELLDDLFSDSQRGSPRETHSTTVQLENEDGTMKEIRKSTLVWLLSESKGKLSSDRLKRVQTVPESSAKRRKEDPKNVQISAQNDKLCRKVKEIEIGQWCFFKHIFENTGEREHCANILEMVIVGYIVDFKYVEAKTAVGKRRIFNSDFADTDPKARDMTDVLGSWYRCDQNGSLCPIEPKNCFLISMEKYLGTTMLPNNERDQLNAVNFTFGDSILEIINDLTELYDA